MSKKILGEEYLNIKEVGKILDIHPDSLLRMNREGRLERLVTKIGREFYMSRKNLENYVRGNG